MSTLSALISESDCRANAFQFTDLFSLRNDDCRRQKPRRESWQTETEGGATVLAVWTEPYAGTSAAISVRMPVMQDFQDMMSYSSRTLGSSSPISCSPKCCNKQRKWISVAQTQYTVLYSRQIPNQSRFWDFQCGRGSGGHGFGLWSIQSEQLQSTGLLLRTILCTSLVLMPRVKFVEKCTKHAC